MSQLILITRLNSYKLDMDQSCFGEKLFSYLVEIYDTQKVQWSEMEKITQLGDFENQNQYHYEFLKSKLNKNQLILKIILKSLLNY